MNDAISKQALKLVRSFWKDDAGQDLIEYTLLLAFVALASGALFLSAGGSINVIWTVANNELSVAGASAS
jgi:Flp pilus assembly pilin Flp